MGHGLALLLEFLQFTGLQVRTCQLLVLELQEIGILTVTFNVFLQLLEFFLGFPEVCVCLLVTVQFLFVRGDDIYDIQLEVLFVQQQVLMLRMYIDKHFAEFLEQRQWHGCVIDECAALA